MAAAAAARLMVLSELLAGMQVLSVRGPVDPAIAGIAYDSRKVAAGTLFVAVRGEHADGHAFIGAARTAGAVAAVVEHGAAFSAPEGMTIVEVADSRTALADLANVFYGDPTRRLTLVGITGTNGKTTSTNIVRHFLEGVGTPTGLVGTIEYGFGGTMVPATHTTPESVDLCAMFSDMAARGARAVVMEVSSHALALGRVRGFTFAAAAFTNLTQDHLDFHLTMEQYANAKAELFRMLSENAVAVINADDPYGTLMAANTRAAVVRYGLTEASAVRAERIRFGLNGTEFVLTLNGQRFNVTSPYLGMFNVYNLLGGIATVAGLGVDATEIVRLIPTLPQVRGRLERIPLPNGAVAIVDYAHTPDALQRAIETVRVLVEQSHGRVITVFGCGGDRDRTKRPIMGRIGASLSDIAFVTSDNPRTEDPRSIINEILEGIDDQAGVNVVVDRAEAIARALAESRRGDVVLLAGKGHETYQVVGTVKQPFDDAAQARAFGATQPV